MTSGTWVLLKRRGAGFLASVALAGSIAVVSGPYLSASSADLVMLPEIRMTPMNRVPACVTPERLMAFLQTRNRALDPRFRSIAEAYRTYGEAWRVRWDYAFFQMAVETNFLSFRQPNGRMGDVDPRQNNFAGIGTTGGGVPGDRFPDVNTGVLGQIQHLVAYSGEYVAEPVAERTRLKQVHILRKSHELLRPVRFSDLARRWAADPKYASSIEWVARSYRQLYCAGGVKPWVLPDQGGASRSSAAPMSAPPSLPQRPAELMPWQAPPSQVPAAPGSQVPGPQGPGARPPVSLFTTGSIDRPGPSVVTTVWRRGEQTPAEAHGQPQPVDPSGLAKPDEDAGDHEAAGGFALFKAPEWLATVKPEPQTLPPPSGLGMRSGVAGEPAASGEPPTPPAPAAQDELPFGMFSVSHGQ